MNKILLLALLTIVSCSIDHGVRIKEGTLVGYGQTSSACDESTEILLNYGYAEPTRIGVSSGSIDESQLDSLIGSRVRIKYESVENFMCSEGKVWWIKKID